MISIRNLFTLVTLNSLILFSVAQVTYANSEKIDPEIINQLNERHEQGIDGPLPVIVMMETPTVEADFGSWEEPSAAEKEYLRKKAVILGQTEMREYVNSWVASSDYVEDRGIQDFEFHWAVNAMSANASLEAMRDMIQMESVQYILYDRSVQLTFRKDGLEPQGEYTYGLERIGIPQLRLDYPEVNGEGVVVGILDTGIDADHPELKGKVVAWKDFVNRAELEGEEAAIDDGNEDRKEGPYDDNGHGTHVAGTIAGEGLVGTQFGVAPRAKLVVAKILSGGGSGRVSWIVDAMEWITNPENTLNSELRPRVVNNSWGGSMGRDIRRNPFTELVMTWVELDIFPAFAAGNSGPGRSTIGSPGGLPMAFAVGATDSEDGVARFSSRGPTKIIDMDGNERTLTKPDLSAPGYKVFSTMPNGEYQRLSGTSMATPHVAGVIALLYQVNPNLSIEQMIQLLSDSSLDLGDEGKDNDYGAGRMDVYKAVDVLNSYGHW